MGTILAHMFPCKREGEKNYTDAEEKEYKDGTEIGVKSALRMRAMQPQAKERRQPPDPETPGTDSPYSLQGTPPCGHFVSDFWPPELRQ